MLRGCDITKSCLDPSLRTLKRRRAAAGNFDEEAKLVGLHLLVVFGKYRARKRL
jgi:hypothetical protein